MTIFSVAGGERAVTVRYIPLVAWGFGAAAAYGVGDIVRRLAGGGLPATAGSLGALLLLVAFAGFVLYSGGQLVVASFDRAADRVSVRRYGITGATVTERPLSDLAGLEVRVLRRAQHRLELRFRSGERMPLTPYYVVSFNSRGLRRLSAALGLQPTIAAAARR